MEGGSMITNCNITIEGVDGTFRGFITKDVECIRQYDEKGFAEYTSGLMSYNGKIEGHSDLADKKPRRMRIDFDGSDFYAEGTFYCIPDGGGNVQLYSSGEIEDG